nr:acylphosphatase [Tissierella sp.]
MERKVINIFGRVQKVGFRFSILQKARQMNITGCVRNLRDGSVEVEAQGAESEIEKFVEWCKKGPPYSEVKKIIIEDIEVIEDSNKFEIMQ